MDEAPSLRFNKSQSEKHRQRGQKEKRNGGTTCLQVASEGGVVWGRGVPWWLHKLVYRIFPVAEPRGHHPTNKQLPKIRRRHSLPTKNLKKNTRKDKNLQAVISFNNRSRQLQLHRVNGSGNRRRRCTLWGEYCNFYNNNAAAVRVPAIHYRKGKRQPPTRVSTGRGRR